MPETTYTLTASIQTSAGKAYPHTQSGVRADDIVSTKRSVEQAILQPGDAIMWGVSADAR